MEQKEVQELLKSRLKEKGLKVTRQRLLVLSVLEQNSGRHMTAEDIYELVSEDYPDIGLATVYRTLQLLWTGSVLMTVVFAMRSDIFFQVKRSIIIIISYAGSAER